MLALKLVNAGKSNYKYTLQQESHPCTGHCVRYIFKVNESL